MKKIFLSLVAVAFLAATMFTTTFAAEQKETLVIDYLKNSKPPVTLPHKKHVEVAKLKCKDCHHKLKADTDTPKACKECHKANAETDVGGEKAPAALHNEKGNKNIFHDRCVACHKEKDKGPTKCKECHKE